MTQSTQPILSIENLSISIPKGGDRAYAVEGVSLEVRPQEILCVIGESGSGKSVTSFATMGLLPKALQPSAGKIIFEGQNLLDLPERKRKSLCGDQMAMIFQEPMTALNPCYTVGNQIEEIFKKHRKMSGAERKQRVLDLLTEVHLPEPEHLRKSYPHQLSGGQRQRVMIAMALALDPKLLIADEPTTALDVTTQAQILSLLKELKTKHSAGILFITHDFGVVAEIADRVVVMKNGHIVEHGSADDVLNRPRHAYTKMLISAVPRQTGAPPRDLEDSPVTLTAGNIVKTFHTSGGLFGKTRTVQAVKGASFEVRRGETLGIVGESGSGKTTLVRCLIKLLEPDSGKIVINDVDFAALSHQELRAHRKDIQIIFQDPYSALNPRRTIGELLIEGPLNFGVPRAEAVKRAAELLKIVQLSPDCLERYPAQFSGGQRQRICIARALAVEPKVLIADEAVSALDVSVQKEVLNLLADIRDEFGLTLVFITHDLRVAAQICDNIIVMKDGEIVERGTVDAVFNAPTHAYTQQLLAAEPGKDWKIPDFETANGSPPC
ncbi:ABC transporter ATP-binding protein [Profundibacter amoris]|uniref:ABC transporter ATP-binding protein n=1 Tax=Profundibacter amoris TaxID=2171755 RepID=A0A347UFT2_9RHOB|nr:ABC transporter ATP-binding protein [Profundibacter amoris]AXX97710.1 ABC transporter ATP-binding protein [Profundibacter amoris]